MTPRADQRKKRRKVKARSEPGPHTQARVEWLKKVIAEDVLGWHGCLVRDLYDPFKGVVIRAKDDQRLGGLVHLPPKDCPVCGEPCLVVGARRQKTCSRATCRREYQRVWAQKRWRQRKRKARARG